MLARVGLALWLGFCLVTVASAAPTIALLPIQVEDENPLVKAQISEMARSCFEPLGFKLISQQSIWRAMDELNVKLFDNIPPPTRQVVPMPEIEYLPIVSRVVLDEKTLVNIGRKLGTDYAAGVLLSVYSKHTTHFMELRLNGRCTIEVIVVDVKKDEVVFHFGPKEFSVDNNTKGKKQTRQALAGFAYLAITGKLGDSERIKALGWLALITPHYVCHDVPQVYECKAAFLALTNIMADFSQVLKAQE